MIFTPVLGLFLSIVIVHFQPQHFKFQVDTMKQKKKVGTTRIVNIRETGACATSWQL